jgi:hypothetical protein
MIWHSISRYSRQYAYYSRMQTRSPWSGIMVKYSILNRPVACVSQSHRFVYQMFIELTIVLNNVWSWKTSSLLKVIISLIFRGCMVYMWLQFGQSNVLFLAHLLGADTITWHPSSVVVVVRRPLAGHVSYPLELLTRNFVHIYHSVRITHRPNFGPVWYLVWPPWGQNRK